MPIGAPDWQGLRWKVEATLRPNLVYPSGKIILHDDFESPTLKWNVSGTTNWEANITTTEAFKGSTSLRMLTGSGATYNVEATRYIGVPVSNRLGVQFSYVNSVVCRKLSDCESSCA